LAKGSTVVCDRYAYSGVAFSAAKVKPKKDNSAEKGVTDADQSEEPLLSLNWCMSADVGLPAPGAVIFLDLTQEEAEQRGG